MPSTAADADGTTAVAPGGTTSTSLQALTVGFAEELFPNLSDGDFLPADFKEDEEAGFMGLPFIQPEGDDEWVDNVPWEEVPEEAAL